MINVKNLTESLENKYSLTEAYEEELESEIDRIMDNDSLSEDEKRRLVHELFDEFGLLDESLNKKYLNESLSIEEAIIEELNHQRIELGVSEDEICQAGILEEIWDSRVPYDLTPDDQEWLDNLMTKGPFLTDGDIMAIKRIFRSIGEGDIPFDLDLTESLEKKSLNEALMSADMNRQYAESLEDFERWLEDGDLDIDDFIRDLYLASKKVSNEVELVFKVHDWLKRDIEPDDVDNLIR